MSKSIIKQKRILTKASGGSSLATPVSIANGGTGLSSYAVGDILYASGTTTLSKLPIGTASQQLRVNAGATALEYFTPAGSGITVGTTTITSGTTGSVLMDISGIVTESASYRAQQASPAGTAFGYNASYGAGTDGYGTVVGNTVYGYEASPSMNVTGRNTFIGYRAGYAYTSGSSGFGGNTFVGWSAGVANSSSLATTLIGAYIQCANYNSSVGIGYACTVGGDQTIVIGQASASGYSVSIGHEAAAAGNYNASIGYQAGKTNTGSYNTFLNTGQFSSSTISYSIGVGYSAIPTANHQAVLGGNHANGYIDNVYFNGVTHTAPYSINLRACGGSGSNNVAANLNFYVGLSTGSGTPATMGFYSSAAGASSSTAQTAVKVLEITNSTTITTSDAVNYTLGSTTGTKFGTANTQKLAFWNATPIVQPSGATQAAPAAYATGAFGLDSDANMQALYDLVVAMRTALVNVGIMKGSA